MYIKCAYKHHPNNTIRYGYVACMNTPLAQEYIFVKLYEKRKMQQQKYAPECVMYRKMFNIMR